jgi:hypothetical protein
MSDKETSIQAALRDFLNSELKGFNLYRHYTERSCMGLVKYTNCDNKNKTKDVNFTKRETRSVYKRDTNTNTNTPRYETRSFSKRFSKR